MVLVACFICMSAPDGLAQKKQKSRYEKVQERKNKANRRLKRRGDKGKSNKSKLRQTRFKSRNRQGDRAYKGDITGRKVERIKPSTGSRAAYPQPNPYAKRGRSQVEKAKKFRGGIRYSNRKRERAWGGGRIRPRTASRAREQDGARFSGQRFKGVRSVSGNFKSPKNGRVIPRSASGAYRIRKRKKPYAWRERSKWEKAYKGDITGRKFRAKGSPARPKIQAPPKVKYSGGQGRKGDKAYKGQMAGGFRSATRPSERAWKNDISGHKLRKRTSAQPDFDSPMFAPYPKRKRRGDRAFKGKLKGGGFKSAGRPTERTSKRVQGKGPNAQDMKTARFQGNLKGGKPLKGGGSISGKRWNNNGKAIEGRGMKGQDLKIAHFQGNIKGGKPLKGGGSISGKRWNNKGQPVKGRGIKSQDLKTARFQGNLRGKKPKKGGGSLKRNQWNNDGNPIQGKGMTGQDQQIAKHTGNIRQWKYQTGPLDEMKYTGDFKRKRNYVRNPHSAKAALKTKKPTELDRKTAKHTGNIRQWKYQTGPLDEMKYKGDIKRPKYKKNPRSAGEALKVKAPEKNYYKAGNFQGRFKRDWKAKRNPQASEEAVKSRAPGKATVSAMKFSGRFKSTGKYKKKPYAAERALKGIGPSRAAIQTSNYQGNIKMKKVSAKGKHPSFKYTRPNNTIVQKTKFSLSVLWAKLFKKNESQPENVKEKERAPRYDKREKDLWYD